MMVKDLREFIFENYHKQIGFTKEGSYFLMEKAKRKTTTFSIVSY